MANLENTAIVAFNRGRISSKALARVDLKRMAFSADVQTNFPPRVLGSMMARPGWEHILSSASDNPAKYIPFVFSTADICLLEMTPLVFRPITGDAVVTRQTVATTISNGTFASDLTGWTDADETGATSAWDGGFLSLVGTQFDAAIRRQEVTVASGDQGVEHGVSITVERGPVSFKIGTTAGSDDYITEKTLRTGVYSFVFTPTGNFHIELAGREKAASLVDTVAVDAGGTFSLPTPWAESDLGLLRWDQSADVVFIACRGYQTRRIDRFDTADKSWGISLYEPDDGPFDLINSTDISLTPSALTGDITLTASRALFRSTHVGALFSIVSQGQKVEATLTGEDQFTDDESMRIIGVGNSRIFDIDITGTWVGTITLQRSIDEAGSFTDVTSFTTNQDTTHDDGLDNTIAFYRIGFKTGDYTSGTATVTLEHTTGGFRGTARITAVASSTSASAAVKKALGSINGSRDWQEGQWSDLRGYPSALSLYEGRLWFTGKGRYWGSISDAFDSHDEDVEGDSGPINRSIGSGPIDQVEWMLPLQRLLAGTAGAEVSARSTTLDEPLTPDNFNIKNASTQGSAAVPALIIDTNGIFLQRGGTRVYELSFPLDSNDYLPTDLTDIIPEIGEPSIVRWAVQRQPDTRIHAVRSDGTVAILVRELDNDVLAWFDVETRSGDKVLDVVVLPGSIEDAIYYHVERTVGGATVRLLEKWALESEAVGGTVNKMADSFATFTNTPAAASVPAGTASHLAGEDVVVWADGVCLEDADGDIATFTVGQDGGISALTDLGASFSATTGVVGLAYRSRFKSTKLAYASQLGTALTQTKNVSHVGLIMENVHHKAVRVGPSFDVMDAMPEFDDQGAQVADNTVHAEYDKDMQEFPGGWETDARLCLEVNAPRPATILGLVISIDENDKA